MISWKKVLRVLFGSKTSSKNDYLVWAKTEYSKDWQFAYQHMLDNNGAPPTTRDINPWNDGSKFKPNTNLTGWV